MKSETHSTDLPLGTSSPFWTFSALTSTLNLFDMRDSTTAVEVRLSANQAERIRRMNERASISLIDAQLGNGPVRLHLAGKQTNTTQWAGVAAVLPESEESGAQDFVGTLTFADQIVSGVNAVVVVLDRDMKIRRFNELAEEYTGVTEQDVVGQSAHDLFMSSDEARRSRDNISGFFEQGRATNVERVINTKEGPRVFLFKNSLVTHPYETNESFLVCSGVEVLTPADGPHRCRPSDEESHTLRLMDKVMNWAALVDGVRALLGSIERGDGNPNAIAHAKRLASQALADAYTLHEELDARLLQ